MVGLTRKLFDELALPAVLWTRSTRVYGVVRTYAGGQSSASSSRLCTLFYCMTLRLRHLTVPWRGVSMSLVPSTLIRRVMGYCWNDFISNQRLLYETESRPVTSIVRERQLWLYGQVARLPDVDPPHRVVCVRDNPSGGARGDTHVTRGWGKSINYAKNCLGWEGW